MNPDQEPRLHGESPQKKWFRDSLRVYPRKPVGVNLSYVLYKI